MLAGHPGRLVCDVKIEGGLSVVLLLESVHLLRTSL